MRDAELLERVRSWANERRERFPDGLSLELKESPKDRDPRSVQMTLDGGARVGELVVWGNGMAELSYGDFETGVIRPEHRDIASPADLESALDALLEWSTS